MVERIICLEGIVGAGKSTQVGLLYSHLSPNCYLIPELNQYSPMIEAIARWKLQLAKRGRSYSFEEEDIIDLAKARAQTQKLLLKEAKTKTVVMDRGIYTSVAFESDRISPEDVEKINISAGVIIPDECIILDCSVETALTRVDERRIRLGIHKQRAAHENDFTITRIRKAYQEIAKRKCIPLINTEGTEQEIFEQVRRTLKV